ncbi:hypothetical protein ACWER6_26240 [Streptomyces sp. NPDC004009]
MHGVDISSVESILHEPLARGWSRCAASNRSKADQDPSTWLPPTEGYRCAYVTDWIADKIRWGLSIDATEQASLSDALSHCPDVPVTVTTARYSFETRSATA